MDGEGGAERRFSWPEYRQFVFGPPYALVVAGLAGLVALVGGSAARGPGGLVLLLLVEAVLLGASALGPGLVMRAINRRIREAWEDDEIGDRLAAEEARRRAREAPAAYRLRYRYLQRGRAHFGSLNIVGGWSSFVLEEKATGRRWAVRFDEGEHQLGIGDLWDRIGAKVELAREG